MTSVPSPQAGSEGRIRLVVVSPRVPAGMLTKAGWEAFTEADVVFAADADPRWLQVVDDARDPTMPVVDLAEESLSVRAGRLVEAAAAGQDVAWLGSPDGDPGLTDLIAEHVSRLAVAGVPPVIEVVSGNWDAPGARVLDLVAVMDRLRSPGGCPWDAEQTHESLLRYLLEETHEVIEAVEAGDREHLREELGDLLLQVVFHARLAQEDERAPFGIDEVAAGIVAKMVRRHPHVFGADDADGTGSTDGAAAAGSDAGSADGGDLTASDVVAGWEQRKAAEKRREGPFEGIPATLPALARAQKMLHRLASLRPDLDRTALVAEAADGDQAAEALLAAVALADAGDVDAEGSLRRALARLADRAG
ncbi:MAG: MazG family protein [Kineosporiaceae bacterium]